MQNLLKCYTSNLVFFLIQIIINRTFWITILCFVLFFQTRILQEKLDQPVSAPPSPRDVSMEIDSPENMMRHIRFLKNEVERLKKSLRTTELQRKWPLNLSRDQKESQSEGRDALKCWLRKWLVKLILG